MLNNLNRGLGHADAYPFVLSPPAIAKLKFVDDVVGRAKAAGPARVVHPKVITLTRHPNADVTRQQS